MRSKKTKKDLSRACLASKNRLQQVNPRCSRQFFGRAAAESSKRNDVTMMTRRGVWVVGCGSRPNSRIPASRQKCSMKAASQCSRAQHNVKDTALINNSSLATNNLRLMMTIVQNEISLILIATASILMDRILRQDLVSERLQCQVWIWLALALSIRSSSSFAGESNTVEVATTTSALLLHESTFRIFENWLHGVLFANIGAIFAQTGTVNIGPLVTQRYRIADLFPLSVWFAMIASSVPVLLIDGNADSPSSSSSSFWYFDSRGALLIWTCQVFVVSLGVMWALQWHWNRKARIDQEVQAIPFTDNYSTSNRANVLGGSFGDSSRIDESQWYTWSVAQTWQWLSSQVRMAMKEEDLDDAKFVLRLLAPHRICGSVLDTLRMPSVWVETLHIPYGPAVQLSQAIEGLILHHPKPRTHNGTTTIDPSFSQSTMEHSSSGSSTLMERQPDWLTLHDREYNNPSSFRQRPTYSSSKHDYNISDEGVSSVDAHHSLGGGVSSYGNATPSHYSFRRRSEPAIIPAMEPGQEEKLAQLMKERYGLELPTLKPVSNTTISAPPPSERPTTALPRPGLGPAAVDIYPHHYPSAVLPTPPPDVPPIQENSPTTPPPLSSSSSSIPSSLLAQMPQEIREVAQRRPDLVQKLLLAKTQTSQQQQPQESQQRHYNNNNNMTIPEEEEEDEEEFLDDGFEDEDTTPTEDETTSLIQRRGRPKYKSTEGDRG